MNKDINNAGDTRADGGSARPRQAGSRGQRSDGSSRKAVNPQPQTEQESRSDQEQEGTQNPAGDTREVSREPVDDAEK